MRWKGKKVLVTGAGGFIGSHLSERLVELGAHTRGLVHYNALGTWGWLDRSEVRNEMEVVSGDICDRDSVLQAMQGVEIIFHLAALIAIPYSYHTPASYVRTNVEGTLNVLQAARQICVERLVHTSTSEVYGTARYVPIDEEHPLQGQSPYSATKIAADKLAEAFHLSFELPVTIIRPFNTYGPRQSARAIIPTIITQALTQPAVRLGNLQPLRDLTYVEDTVEGFIKIAQEARAIGHVINVGSGKEISIGELGNTILKLLHKDVAIVHDTPRVRPSGSEVERLCASTRKAEKLLGWHARNSLKEGLTKTIEWIEKNLEGYRPDIYTI